MSVGAFFFFFCISSVDLITHLCLDFAQKNFLLSRTVDFEVWDAPEYTAYQRDS